jgi:hypothetical protein
MPPSAPPDHPSGGAPLGRPRRQYALGPSWIVFEAIDRDMLTTGTSISTIAGTTGLSRQYELRQRRSERSEVRASRLLCAVYAQIGERTA